MGERYYCPEMASGTARLTGSEAHHALHVMRHKVGDCVQLFDGAGTVAAAVIESISRRQVELSIESRETASRSGLPPITVAACSPKGDRLKTMVEKLTEIGVSHFVPLQTERSVVDPGTRKLDKLAATVVSAAKQCGRAWLMDIREPVTLGDLLERSGDGETLVVAHPGESGNAGVSDPLASDDRATLLIGPEGGFTPAEVESLRAAGACFTNWPENILRTETAAVVFAAMLLSGNAQKL